MASVIAFRARHCIIDLTGFTVPEGSDSSDLNIPSLYDSITNLLNKNIIPVFKFRKNNATETYFEPVYLITTGVASSSSIRVESDDNVYCVAESSEDDPEIG